MGKKKRKKWRAARQVHDRMVHKIPEKKAERHFHLMEEFAGYGFTSRTPALTLLLAYQTASENPLSVRFMARC